MNDPEKHYYQDDEINLRQFFCTLWNGRWLIALTVAIFSLAGIGYAVFQQNVYEANALVAPVDEEQKVPFVGANLSGLASMAGLNIGGGSKRAAIAKEILKSHAFLSKFIKSHGLEKEIAAIEGWEESTNKWVFDIDLYDTETQKWKTDHNGNSLKPSDWDLVESFRKNHLNIIENRENGMTILSVRHFSPHTARRWVELLITDINDHMRVKDIQEAKASVEFLRTKLSETTVAGMQQMLYQLIESETRTLMLANSRAEYVFETINPAVVPEEKVEPKRALICIAFFMIGLLVGVLIVLVNNIIKSNKTTDEL